MENSLNKTLFLFQSSHSGQGCYFMDYLLKYISEGIYGSTDFAKSRILQEGGKTIEALFLTNFVTFYD